MARYDLGAGRLDWVVAAQDADLSGWLAPDGTSLLVERNRNGAS